ncbi:MAG: FimV/HubP family polar landmark protein, partial [Gammaproteobacteria bacterium]
MSRQAHWGIGLLLLQPLGAWALGLGEIELNSALNQPLNAEIRLISASPEEVDTLKVALASPETFQRYGLDRPSYLGNVVFSLGKDSRGRDVIKVETTQSITEPFVTMLVEASWPRGRLLKEYTVLLDPPVLLPQPEAATVVQTPTANTPSTSQAGGRIQRPASSPAPIAAPRSSPAASRSMPSNSGGTYGPVQRNETLWRIAEQVRPDDRLTMNQMMVALYEANPEAFDGNINRLRRGAVLDVPAGTDIGSITTASANAEVRRQNQDWRGSAGVAEPGLRLVAPDDSRASAGQSTGASGGDDSALRSEVQSLRDELAERDRLLAIRDQELQALQEQLASISETADMADVPPADGAADVTPEDGTAITDPGIEISDDELFADDQADTVPADDVIEPEPAPMPSVTTVVTTAPEKSLLDTVIEWVVSPFALMVAGALAVLIVGLWAVRRRQETATDITGRWEALEAEAEGDAEGDDFARDATARMRAQVAEPDTFVVEEAVPGEPTMPGIDPTTAEAALEDTPALFGDETLSSQTAINLDQADPVAEADFHMAYGLYDQAADLLEKAVNDEPDRRDLKLKLLEVFFVWDNKDSFRQTAQALRTEMGDGADADWDKVAIMGKQICPNDELFSEAVEGAAVDLDLEAGGEAPLDFSLEDSSAGAVDLDLGEAVAEVGSPTAATEALKSI